MVNRVDRGSVPSPSGTKSERRTKTEKPSVQPGAQKPSVESELKLLLNRAGSNEITPDLLISSLIQLVDSSNKIDVDDKKRVIALVKEKIALYPKLKHVFESLEKHLSRK